MFCPWEGCSLPDTNFAKSLKITRPCADSSSLQVFPSMCNRSFFFSFNKLKLSELSVGGGGVLSWWREVGVCAASGLPGGRVWGVGAAAAAILRGAKAAVTSWGRRARWGLSQTPRGVSLPWELLGLHGDVSSSLYVCCGLSSPTFFIVGFRKKGRPVAVHRSDLRTGVCSGSSGVGSISFRNFTGLNLLMEMELSHTEGHP